MTPLQRYLAEEVAEDHVDGLISRREALRRLGLLGLGTTAAASLLAACAREAEQSASTASPAATAAASPGATPEAVETEDITFGPMRGAWAEAADAKGGVLVIHENRGLTPHIRNVTGRFAAAGYSALGLDLLSREGGTEEIGGEAEAMAALSSAPEAQLIGDMKLGLDELEKRLPDAKLAAVGFCYGGGMVWRLLASGEPRLAAAAPFYGPAPEDADFSGSKNAAVLGIYGETDERVTPTRVGAEAALKEAGLTYELYVAPGAGHAFFNDSGERYNAAEAAKVWTMLLDWFEQHLA